MAVTKASAIGAVIGGIGGAGAGTLAGPFGMLWAGVIGAVSGFIVGSFFKPRTQP